MADDVEIKFDRKIDGGFYGSNGIGNMTGLVIKEWTMLNGSEVTLWPVTGKGKVTHSCKITIPREHLAEVIATLSSFLPLTNGEEGVE